MNRTRLVLLAIGLLWLFMQSYLPAISAELQVGLFLSGIVLLGIPHGAADLLVATRNAENAQKTFSEVHFFVNYLGRLLLFAAVLWLFPLAGNVLFIFFAAYHFGETDTHQFKTDNWVGKIFITAYGLVVLGVILLHHFDEVRPLYLLFDAGIKNLFFIDWIAQNRYLILATFFLFFFASATFYFIKNKTNLRHNRVFFVHLFVILFILYHLPMILGFTFYFVVWHSVLSLRNIVRYLRKDNVFSTSRIVQQIGMYSALAMAGILLFGATGFMFAHNDAMLVYVFLGLAVLTAPHMQIMHDMYKSMRMPQARTKESQI